MLGLGGHAMAQSFTDFQEAAWSPLVGLTVNDRAPDGSSVNISNVNNCVSAWRVGNSGPTTEDEEVVDTLGDHGRVWRLSQGGTIGDQGNGPHSPNNGTETPLTAGETGASNDASCGRQPQVAFMAKFGLPRQPAPLNRTLR